MDGLRRDAELWSKMLVSSFVSAEICVRIKDRLEITKMGK